MIIIYVMTNHACMNCMTPNQHQINTNINININNNTMNTICFKWQHRLSVLIL